MTEGDTDPLPDTESALEGPGLEGPGLDRREPDLPLDGVTSVTVPIPADVETRTAAASDPNAPLETRIEAFEDLMDSEIGDTSMTRARNLERATGLRQLYLKFEGSNPTGTQKDRIGFAQAMDALRRGFDGLTLATCGNYGAAAALAASLAGLRCIVFIPETYKTQRIGEIEAAGAFIIRSAGDYERAVELSKEYAQTHELYDANPGGANTALQLKAYGEIAYEIYDDLRDAPGAVATSVSNGTTFVGLYRGFLSLHRRGKTSRLPKFVAGSSHNKNPIIRAFRKKSTLCEDLRPETIRESLVNEPLVNWHATDGDLALDAIRKSQGTASYASDKGMVKLARMLRDLEGLTVLPAATAGLYALLEFHRITPLPPDRYVAVLTGRKGLTHV